MLAKRLLLVVCLSVTIRNGMFQPQNQVPKDLFKILTNKSATTEEFLKSLAPNVLKNAIKIGSLPKRPKGVTSRNYGSAPSSILDFENQLCIIRPYVHVLRQPHEKENALIWPYAIQLPRCIGSCNSRSLYCTAIQSRKVSFVAYKLSYGYITDAATNTTQPNTIITQLNKTIVIHEKCDCKCSVNQEICEKMNKTFDKDYCRCYCPLPIPTCPPNRQWNEKKCACDCIGKHSKNIQRCQRDSHHKKYWEKKTCSCVCFKVKGRKPCRNKLKIQDPNTCSCVCELDQSSCLVGKTFDRRRCRCG